MTGRMLAGAPPRRMLLATDLSSRGDRALDRATQLALQWGAQLHVVHVVDAPPPSVPAGVDQATFLSQYPDPASEARRRLGRLIEHVDASVQVCPHVASGVAAQEILALVEREGCDFVIFGESREFALNLVESTVEQVVRKAAASVLVVRSRPAGEYLRLLVGTDYTDEAQQALVTAARLFPKASIALVHGYQVPSAGMVEGSEAPWVTEHLARLGEQVDASEIPESRKSTISKIPAIGPPATVLRQHVEASEIDLTVIGAHPRGLLFDAVVGRSRSILFAIPGDILVVRAVRRDP